MKSEDKLYIIRRYMTSITIGSNGKNITHSHHVPAKVHPYLDNRLYLKFLPLIVDGIAIEALMHSICYYEVRVGLERIYTCEMTCFHRAT